MKHLDEFWEILKNVAAVGMRVILIIHGHIIKII